MAAAERAATTTSAPAWAKPRAMALPIPLLPPVTIATLPLKSNIDDFIATTTSPSDHGIYAQKLTPDGQLMHFRRTTEYGTQYSVTVVMLHRKVIGAAIGTVKPVCPR